MSKVEKTFLVEKTYGTKYVGAASDFNASASPPLRPLAGIRGAAPHNQDVATAANAAPAATSATAAAKSAGGRAA